MGHFGSWELSLGACAIPSGPGEAAVVGGGVPYPWVVLRRDIEALGGAASWGQCIRRTKPRVKRRYSCKSIPHDQKPFLDHLASCGPVGRYAGCRRKPMSSRSRDATPLRMVGTVQDNHRSARPPKNSLRASEERFRAAIEAARTESACRPLDQHLVHVPVRSTGYWAIPPEEMQGGHGAELVVEEQRSDLQQLSSGSCLQPGSSERIQLKLRHKNGGVALGGCPAHEHVARAGRGRHRHELP